MNRNLSGCYSQKIKQMSRPQSQESPRPNAALSSSQNFSIGSHLSGFNALLKSKSKLQDEFFQNQREVRKREGELQKTLAVQDQKIMQLQETISSHQAREIQLKQMYDKILQAFSGDSGNMQQSLLLMFDLTQNSKDECIQQLMQKLRSVLNSKVVTKSRNTQTESESADADTSTSSIVEKHCIRELHEVIDKMKAHNERLNGQIVQSQKEYKLTIQQIKSQYEKQVSEMKLQIDDLKLTVIAKIGDDDFGQSQSQQMQAQLMNDNIQMHEIIELLKGEAEEQSKSASQAIQSLIKENQSLQQELKNQEKSASDVLNQRDESARLRDARQAEEVQDLKQQVANALKIAGEKSDDANKFQMKLEKLLTRIEDKKRSRLVNQQLEEGNSTPAYQSKNFNLPQKSDLSDRSYKGIASMKSPQISDTLTLMSSPQDSKRESLKSGRSSKADQNSNDHRGMIMNTEAAPLDLLQSHAKLYQKYLSSVKSPAFIGEASQHSSEKKNRCITPSYTRKDIFEKYGSYDPNSNKSEDGCIVYGTISKQDRNTNSKLDRSPELTNLVDQIVTEIKKLDHRRQSAERMHCSCESGRAVVQCTHYHYPGVEGATIQKMESQLAKLADNNYKLKQMTRDKEASEEKCSKLKGKLNGLKQQVDQSTTEKFEAILKCQHLELRLKQAQQVLSGGDETPMLMTAKNVQQMDAAQILGISKLGQQNLALVRNQEFDQQSISTERYYEQKYIQSLVSPRSCHYPKDTQRMVSPQSCHYPKSPRQDIQRMVSPRNSLHPNVKLNHNQQKQKTAHQSTVGSPTTSNDKVEIQKSRAKGVPLLQLNVVNDIGTVKLFRSPTNLAVSQVLESERSSGQQKTQRRIYSNRYEDVENEMMLIKQEKSPLKLDQISPIVPPDKSNKKNAVKQAKVPTMLMRASTYSHFER